MKFKYFAVIILAFLIISLPSKAQEVNPQQTEYIVKVFYFYPNDRQPQPDIDEKLDTIVKKSQQFYANEMERHGFERKTFQLEIDKEGKTVVHHVIGKQETAVYQKNPARSFKEIDKNLYKANKTVRLVYVDHGKKVLPGSACGLAYTGKKILIPAAGGCCGVGVTVHELGHAFGLPHGVGGLKGMSIGASYWLDVNRYFNPDRDSLPTDNEAQIRMLPSSIAYPPNNQHVFFEINDPDKLKIARFMHGASILHSPEILSRENEIVKFTNFGEPIKNNRLKVVTADVKGGASYGKWLSLDQVEPYMTLNVSYNETAAQDGLIGYWTLDEAKGPYVFNRVGNKHNAKLKEGVNLHPNTGKIGGALATTWKHGAIVENGAELINGLGAFTIALWVKADEIGTNRGLIATKKTNKKDQSFSLRYNPQGTKGGGINTIKAAINTTKGVQTYESANNVQTNDWQHIALTWNSGEKLALYINGVLDKPTFNSTSKQGVLSGADRLVIGKGTQDNHTSWRGLIDDVRLYNRVLSANEIANLPHVTKTSESIYGVSISGVADLSDEIIRQNTHVKYILTITNTGNVNDTIKLTASGQTNASLSQTSVSLKPGTSSEVILSVPKTVGEHEIRVQATSNSNKTKSSQIIVTSNIKKFRN